MKTLNDEYINSVEAEIRVLYLIGLRKGDNRSYITAVINLLANIREREIELGNARDNQ